MCAIADWLPRAAARSTIGAFLRELLSTQFSRFLHPSTSMMSNLRLLGLMLEPGGGLHHLLRHISATPYKGQPGDRGLAHCQLLKPL